MTVKLKVPFVTQLGIGSHAGPDNVRDDPTGCWYASACMVAYYFSAGPRQGLPELFKRDLGNGVLGHYATGSRSSALLNSIHHKLLATREKLAPVEKCNSGHNYDLDFLEERLRQSGPIFFYWMKPHGGGQYGHASVVIGTSRTGVVYHDPENAPDSTMTLAQFNQRRQKWKYALMQRKTSRIAARRAMFGN